jgi:hypothetical protein
VVAQEAVKRANTEAKAKQDKVSTAVLHKVAALLLLRFIGGSTGSRQAGWHRR